MQICQHAYYLLLRQCVQTAPTALHPMQHWEQWKHARLPKIPLAHSVGRMPPRGQALTFKALLPELPTLVLKDGL
jgi:hypothetical protein